MSWPLDPSFIKTHPPTIGKCTWHQNTLNVALNPVGVFLIDGPLQV